METSFKALLSELVIKKNCYRTDSFNRKFGLRSAWMRSG